MTTNICSFTLNFREGSSDKFYFAELDGTKVTVRYGRAYSSGQRGVKHFATPEEAAKEFFKLARGKMRKGYRITEAKVAGESDARLSPHRWSASEYGSVVRERAEISLDTGAKMIHNLTLPTPDEDLLFESMFADGDCSLIASLARTHPAVGESDVAGLGAWLSGAKFDGGQALLTA